MSNHPEDPRGTWQERIDAYLDGKLNQDESRIVEESILNDPEAKESLFRTMLFRGLSDDGDDSDTGMLEECRRACDLMAGYISGEIDGTDVAFLSRHLESCESCEEEYDSLRHPTGEVESSGDDNADFEAITNDAIAQVRAMLSTKGDAAGPPRPAPAPRRRMPQWMTFVIPGAAVAIVCTSLLLDSGRPDGLPSSPWPILPIPSQELADLVLAVTRMENESDPVDEAMAICRRADPEYLRRVAEDPTIKAELSRLALGGLTAGAYDRITFLLAVLHEPRLTPGEQGRALEPLRRALGERGREMFWRTAEGTDQAAIFSSASYVLALGKFRREEMDRLRALFDRAIRMRFDSGLGGLIDHLAALGHPDTPDICLGLLHGRYGKLRSQFPPAASKLIAFARNQKRPDLLRKVEEVATSGPSPIGRLTALRSLWLDNPSPRWDAEILGFADDEDPVLRRIVSYHLDFASDPEHLPIIEAMMNDSDPSVRVMAGTALKRLTGELPKRKLR